MESEIGRVIATENKRSTEELLALVNDLGKVLEKIWAHVINGDAWELLFEIFYIEYDNINEVLLRWREQ